MQRKLHPLEGIVAICALFFVLALTVGFAQAADEAKLKKVYLRSASVLVQDADSGEVVYTKNSDAIGVTASAFLSITTSPVSASSTSAEDDLR